MFRLFQSDHANSFQRLILLAVVGSFFLVEQTSAQTPAAVSDQTKVVRAIFEATKTAKTEKDLTAFLQQCNQALAGELSKANRDYVVSLTGWGLNRRGEKRFELASQLKKIGNNRADAVMQQAMEDFDKSILTDPQRVRSWMSRGIAHMSGEDIDSAIGDFTQATKLKTDGPSSWFNRAEALYQRGNFEYAIKDYDVVLRLNSKDAQALTGRGLSAMSLGQFTKALVDFERVIELQQSNDAAYINRGDALQELGQWQDAKQNYEKALAIEETGIACQRSAWLLATCPDLDVRDEKSARGMIDRAIELDGESPAVLDTLAATEAAEGDFESAKSTQQQVIGLVSAEEDDESPYKTRLLLYEKNEPYVQGKKSPQK